jgi:hypothetical protein
MTGKNRESRLTLQYEFYLEQAAIAAQQAQDATLPRLREMHLRSQAAWQALADVKAHSEVARAERTARN